MIWLKTSVQGLASRRIWGYVSLESQVGCGNGISASWEDGKVHHLLLLMDLFLLRRPQMVLDETLTSR